MAVAAAAVAADVANAAADDDDEDESRHVVAETLFVGAMLPRPAAVNRFDCFCFLSNVGFVELELLLFSASCSRFIIWIIKLKITHYMTYLDIKNTKFN